MENWLRSAGALPVIVFAIIFVVVPIFGLSEGPVFTSSSLVLAMNTIFLAITGAVIAAFAARGFLRYGDTNLMFLGMATIVSGIAAAISGWDTSLSLNSAVAVFDVGLLLSGGLQLASALFTVLGLIPAPVRSRRNQLLVGYSVALGCILLVAAMVKGGLAPQFWSGGATLTREWVVAACVVTFAGASLGYAWVWRQTRSAVLEWYALALALLALNLIGVGVVVSPYSTFSWLSRAAGYLAGIYFVAGFLSVRTSSPYPLWADSLSLKWAEAFRNDSRQLDQLFGRMTDGYSFSRVVYDAGGKGIDCIYLDVNEAFERLMGKRREDLVGRKASEVMGAGQALASRMELYGRVAMGGEPTRLEVYLEPTRKWLSVSVYSPRQGYVITLSQDITQRKELESEIVRRAEDLELQVEKKTKELDDATRLAAIGQTAGMVGHDIRNPLQVVLGALYLADKEVSTLPQNKKKASLTESLDEIRDSVSYINKIVADLQDFSRPLSPVESEADVKGVIDAVMGGIGVPDNIRFTCKVDDDARMVATDPAMLRRVLGNLVSNAIEAMPEGGELTVGASRKDSSILISVRDTGVGIPVLARPKIFTPLYTTKPRGQGFGLAVVKRMTEAVGGTISFESELGRGTEFVVRLPSPAGPSVSPGMPKLQVEKT